MLFIRFRLVVQSPLACHLHDTRLRICNYLQKRKPFEVCQKPYMVVTNIYGCREKLWFTLRSLFLYGLLSGCYAARQRAGQSCTNIANQNVYVIQCESTRSISTGYPWHGKCREFSFKLLSMPAMALFGLWPAMYLKRHCE